MEKDPLSRPTVISIINQVGGTHALFSTLCSGSALMPGVKRFERVGTLVVA